MGQRHPSTAAERAGWISQLIAQAGEYGVVTALSRAVGVSRQSLYTWRAVGLATLEAAFAPPAPPVVTPGLERAILTLLAEGHASYRGLQRCLWEVRRQEASLGSGARWSGWPATPRRARGRSPWTRSVATTGGAPT